jgi:DNA replication licensing factor MCM2
LPVLNEVAFELVGEVYPDYYKIHNEVYIRVKDLPVEDKLRDLRQIHLNALIKIRGVVTKRTGVFPEL